MPLNRRHRRVRINMAGAGTVSQLTGRVLRVGILSLPVWPGFVVVCVTARTVRLKRGELPVDGLRIGLMTGSTQQRRLMILRLIRQACVTVIGWRPGNRVVAQAAILRRVEVTRVLAGGYGAIVAGRTGPQNLVVVHGEYGLPDRRTVAVFADVSRLHMQWALAGSLGAVMAAKAIVHDVRVIKIRRQPGDCRMTVVAIVTAGDVGRVFAGCRDAVMAGTASAYDLGVVDRIRGHPYIAGVAVFANVARLNVRGVFTGGIGTVMAAEAAACDVHVIEIRR